MVLIAENHFQFIIEVAIVLQVGIMLLLNVIPMSLSFVLFVALIISVGLMTLFGIDASFLFFSNVHEFSVPYGPIALLSVVTLLSSLQMMKEVGIKVVNLRIFVFLIIGLIAVFGSIVHRVFLVQWILGLLIGFFIISKSFRQKSFFTIKRVFALAAVVLIAFGSLELLSRILQMSVISPLFRIARIEDNALPSLTMVLKNTTLFGHIPGSAYWGVEDTGFASGYVSLPLTLITFFTLPFPIFYGILVTKKDVIDYFLPGIFGYAFDFGYGVLILLLLYCIAVIFIGFKILADYRKKREKGNRKYLGREALLIGSLTAFIGQALIGLFLSNRSINGMALLTFLFLGSMVLSHVLLMKSTLDK